MDRHCKTGWPLNIRLDRQCHSSDWGPKEAGKERSLRSFLNQAAASWGDDSVSQVLASKVGGPEPTFLKCQLWYHMLIIPTLRREIGRHLELPGQSA